MTERPVPGVERHIADLREAVLEGVRANVDLGAPVALVDYPNHNNCGDNAIWLGERAALSALGARVVAVSDQATYRTDRVEAALGSDGTVLIHGGGNFGSIWPAEQRFRERLVAAHATRRVVQLPQTVHFDTDAEVERAREALHHSRIHVLTRDRRSLAVVRDGLRLPASLCPDPAFALGPLETRRRPRWPIVWMARTDGEGVVDAPVRASDVQVVDWLRGNPYAPSTSWRAAATVRLRHASTALARRGVIPPNGVATPTFDWLARRRVLRGVDVLASGAAVVTDRLHGHILCTLLRRRHVVLDTLQGKISSFLEAFPPPDGLVHVASSTEEALTAARDLVADAT